MFTYLKGIYVTHWRIQRGGGFRGLEPPFFLADQCIWMGTYSWNPPLSWVGTPPFFKWLDPPLQQFFHVPRGARNSLFTYPGVRVTVCSCTLEVRVTVKLVSQSVCQFSSYMKILIRYLVYCLSWQVQIKFQFFSSLMILWRFVVLEFRNFAQIISFPYYFQ